MYLRAIEKLSDSCSQASQDLLAQDISFPSINLYRVFNATLLTLSWLGNGRQSIDETSLLVLNDRYIYLPIDKLKWLSAWNPVINLINNQISFDILVPELHLYQDLIANFPKYNGDFSFHFGHFHRDALGVLISLKEGYFDLGTCNLPIYSSCCRYILPEITEFHIDLIDKLNIPSSIWICKKDISSVIYSDDSKSISALKFNGYILEPSHDFAIKYTLAAKVCKTAFNSQFKASANNQHVESINTSFILSRNVNLSAALLTRNSLLASNKNKRWCNDYEILTGPYSFPFGDKFVHINFSLFDHESLLPLARAKALSEFDFIIGSGSSAMYPSLIFTNILHLIVLPRRPTFFELQKSALRDFRIFGLTRYGFLYPDLYDSVVSQTDDIWQSSFRVEIPVLMRLIESILCSTPNYKIYNKLSY